MRLKLLAGFLRAIYGAPAMFRHVRKVNRLKQIAYSDPTTPEGFEKQREALKELNRMQEF